MKKKKIINIRTSLIASTLALTTLITSLTGCSPKKVEETLERTEDFGGSNNFQENVIDQNENKSDLEDHYEFEIEEAELEDKETEDTEKLEEDSKTVEDITKDTIQTPVKPAIGKKEEEKPVVQKAGQWVSLNDQYEAYRLEDGTINGYRSHNYNTKATNYESNNNGTHNIVTEEICASCGHIKTTIEENVECKDLAFTWDADYEYNVCNECGNKIVLGEHNFDKGTVKGNKKTYSCENDGCGYSYTKPYTPTTPSHSNGGNHNHGGNTGGNTGGSTTDKEKHTHIWSAWTPISDTEHTRTCTVAGCPIITETASHKFGDWSEWSEWIIDEENQIEYRTQTQSCSDCGYVKSNKDTKPYNPSEEHHWSEWEITKEPTCTEDGEEIRKCTDDGCTETETAKIPALGHDYHRVEGNFVSNGDGTHSKSDISTCSRCGDEIDNSINNATCSIVWGTPTNGTGDICKIRTGTCSVCGYTKTETTSHSYESEYDKDHKITTYTCKTCGYSYEVKDPKPEKPGIGDILGDLGKISNVPALEDEDKNQISDVDPNENDPAVTTPEGTENDINTDINAGNTTTGTEGENKDNEDTNINTPTDTGSEGNNSENGETNDNDSDLTTGTENNSENGDSTGGSQTPENDGEKVPSSEQAGESDPVSQIESETEAKVQEVLTSADNELNSLIASGKATDAAVDALITKTDNAIQSVMAEADMKLNTLIGCSGITLIRRK